MLTGPDGANPTLTGGLPFSITDIGLLQEIHDAMWAVLEAEIVHLREENERVMLTQGLKWTLSLNNTRARSASWRTTATYRRTSAQPPGPWSRK